MNFRVNDKAPRTDHFGLYGKSGRFAKVSSIFGANGSGKTNLMLGFRLLKSFISQSFSYAKEGFEGFFPFNITHGEPSFFEVEFYIENIFYKFSLELNSKRVLSEILESRRDKRLITLYSRRYVSSHNSYEFEGKNVNLEDSFIEKVRPNASVISTARQYNHQELTRLKEHWDSIFGKIRLPYLDSFYFPDFMEVSKFYSKNEKYFSQTKDFLKRVDLGLSDVQIETREMSDSRGNKESHFLPYGVHKNKGKTFKLPFLLESGGTLHLYNMLSFIFPVLENGSVYLIDEIEKSLHPNMLHPIIDLFVSPETNPKGAQLIFTTHMSTLTTNLSKHQIFLVEKNPECESDVYRLDEVQGVRNDDNIFKKYLAGSYGGIPDIDL